LFSMGSVSRLYNESLFVASRVEAGSNTSNVTLRVVEGDEKEVSNLKQLNMVTSPTRLRPKNYFTGEGQQQL
jgi:hypothetical protein